MERAEARAQCAWQWDLYCPPAASRPAPPIAVPSVCPQHQEKLFWSSSCISPTKGDLQRRQILSSSGNPGVPRERMLGTRKLCVTMMGARSHLVPALLPGTPKPTASPPRCLSGAGGQRGGRALFTLDPPLCAERAGMVTGARTQRKELLFHSTSPGVPVGSAVPGMGRAGSNLQKASAPTGGILAEPPDSLPCLRSHGRPCQAPANTKGRVVCGDSGHSLLGTSARSSVK